jgi:hypothetical protein
MELVADEILLHPQSPQALNDFLAKYGGTVLRDGTPFVLTPPSLPHPPIESDGWYLIRVDTSRSEIGDLARNLAAAPLGGRYRFSSETAARLIALIAREKHLGIGPNVVLRMSNVPEHPDGAGGNIDASRRFQMTEDDNPNVPGDQGLSVGVVHAWEYLKYLGLPPRNGSFRPARIAIVDGGFALDETTGTPLDGNRDYGIGVMEGDVVDHDGRAGGPNLLSCGGSPCAWHGQSAFGVAAAEPHNSFGFAGTGGDVVWPLLMRVSSDLYTVADGIRSSAISGADVINLSLSGGCGWWEWFCSIPPSDIYDRNRAAVDLARAWGSIVVASAGNDRIDLGGSDAIPCKLRNVICVGAVDAAGMNLFNYGDAVDIWAPTNILSTVTPDSLAVDANFTGIDEVKTFGGTSASSPFVAGILGLMRSLEPNLDMQRAQDILQATANPSSDPKVRTGWVDAFRAVQAVRPNRPPFVQWHGSTSPTTAWTGLWLQADASDPELAPDTVDRWPIEVAFTSNIDGTLCSTRFVPYNCFSGPLTVGTHVLTAMATDAFGASSAVTRTIVALNRPPTPDIEEPAATGSYFAHQPVTLSAFVPDPDEGIPDGAVEWSSDRDGVLGTGWSRSRILTAGTHVISVSATDLHGATGADSVTIDVQSSAGLPSVQILQPAPGQFISPGTSIILRGVAVDPEDGPLTGSHLVWSSDIDGVLGSGESIAVVLSGPAVPCNPEIFIHTVKLRGTDSDGHTVEVKVRITVGIIC